MKKLILASSLGLWDYDDLGNRIPRKFYNTNEIIDNLKK